MTMLQIINDLIEIQHSSMGYDRTDPYMRGLYNGMEMIRSVVAKEEPVFMDKDGQLDKAAMERHPERYL